MKTRLCALLLALTMALAPAAGAVETPQETAPLPALNTTDHIAYISGTGEARFEPNQPLLRATAAHMIFTLLETPAPAPGEDPVSFSDVPAGVWYAQAVTTLASLGILGGYEDGTFQPNGTITRAEFVKILSAFFPLEESTSSFSDLPADHWARETLLSAHAKGWLTGYEDGTIRPDNTITRAEAVTVLNSILGRSAAHGDTQTLIQTYNISPFTDVRPADWFYAAVLEAAVPHTYAAQDSGAEVWNAFTYQSCGYDPGFRLIGSACYQVDENRQITFFTPGFQTIDGKLWYAAEDGSIPLRPAGPLEIGTDLYYVNEDGSLLTDSTVEHLTFGPDGKYTTGDPELDAMTKTALAASTDPSMTRQQKLSACYVDLVHNYRYLSRPHQDRGTTHWYADSAKFMFTNKRGNCYCYTGAFLYMARQLGYQAYGVSGGYKESNSDHAWVMIDGLIYDPCLENVYLYRHSPPTWYDLFHLDPNNAPIIYHFPQ